MCVCEYNRECVAAGDTILPCPSRSEKGQQVARLPGTGSRPWHVRLTSVGLGCTNHRPIRRETATSRGQRLGLRAQSIAGFYRTGVQVPVAIREICSIVKEPNQNKRRAYKRNSLVVRSKYSSNDSYMAGSTARNHASRSHSCGCTARTAQHGTAQHSMAQHSAQRITHAHHTELDTTPNTLAYQVFYFVQSYIEGQYFRRAAIPVAAAATIATTTAITDVGPAKDLYGDLFAQETRGQGKAQHNPLVLSERNGAVVGNREPVNLDQNVVDF